LGVALEKQNKFDEAIAVYRQLEAAITHYRQAIALLPLSSLINLTELFLYNNQTLTDKTCPVKPESICSFVPLQGY
jgi:internalin A